MTWSGCHNNSSFDVRDCLREVQMESHISIRKLHDALFMYFSFCILQIVNININHISPGLFLPLFCFELSHSWQLNESGAWLLLWLISVSVSPCLTEMSGTGADISQVHWKQQWLENGTLYFHVSMSSSEQLSQVTQPTVREPPRVLHEHMHLLHISVMVSTGCTYIQTQTMPSQLSWLGDHLDLDCISRRHKNNLQCIKIPPNST